MDTILDQLISALANLEELQARLDEFKNKSGAAYAHLFFEQSITGEFRRSLISYETESRAVFDECITSQVFRQHLHISTYQIFSGLQIKKMLHGECPDSFPPDFLIILPLEVDGFKMGVITVAYEKDQKQKYRSLMALAEQWARQVAVISRKQAFNLATKLIARRDVEKEVLLALSNEMASVRTRNQLLQIISHQVKPILNFSHIALAHVDMEKGLVTPIVHDPESVCREDERYEVLTTSTFPFNDGYLDRVTENAGPLIFNLKEAAKDPELPLYFKMNVENGIGQALLAKLNRFDRLTGLWGLFFKDQQHWDHATLYLIQGIADQISIAISNIDAIEKLEQKELEKSRLLTEISRYKEQLEEEKIYLKEELDTTQHYSEMIGESTEITKVFSLISVVAPSDSTVLILGETGTGKELVARAIHQYSSRQGKLMVKINCAALPPNLIESELFGHEKGSFTGALERRKGKFELANGGTLFLDEIGEMPIDLQSKLLRVLQEKEIERIGGRAPITVDVRIIAATNRNLEQEVIAGRFRHDLYYRLNIFPIHLPPLRTRKDDISPLASHFIQRFAKRNGKKIIKMGSKAIQQLMHYSWPGNIRELEHLMERTVLITTGSLIKSIEIPSSGIMAQLSSTEDHVIKTIDENERDHIIKVLKACNGRIGGPRGAANLLGVPPTTLSSKIKKLMIKRGFNW